MAEKERQSGTYIFEPDIVEDLRPINASELPPGYKGTVLNLRLPSGTVEKIAYGYRQNREPEDNYEDNARGVLAAFKWILTTESFRTGTTDDDDRAEAIAEVIGAAIAAGLTEDEALHLYKIAYTNVKRATETD